MTNLSYVYRDRDRKEPSQDQLNALETLLDGTLSEIELPYGWGLEVNLSQYPWTLCINAPNATCNFTGKPYPWKGRKFPLSVHMTEGEIVQTALLATLIAIEHETRELFKYKGKAVFNPHKDPLSGDVEVRK